MGKHKNVFDIQDSIMSRFSKQAKHNNTSDPATMTLSEQIAAVKKNKVRTVVTNVTESKPRFARWSPYFYR